MSNGAAILLERAVYLAKAGERNPHTALIRAGDYPSNVDPKAPPLHEDEAKALLAVMREVAPLTLTRWYLRNNPSPMETANLLEDVLFKMQLDG